MSRNVVGLVGPIASGKGTVVKILEEKGYRSYSLSDRIREEITARGLEVTRPNLNLVSNDLRGNISPDILAKRTGDLVEKDNADLVVIDAIRNPHEVNHLKQRFDAKIIGIVADQARRYEFFKARGTNAAGIDTWEQFKELDDREIKQKGAHTQQVQACLVLADTIIENDGSIEDLKKKIIDFSS
jgi:dephospho-CoA kinase